MITLRGYQEVAVNGVRVEYSKKKRRVLLVMPTGAGKTVVFSYITRATALKGKNVLILAHRRELLTQCGDKLKQNEVEFGYLNPAFTAHLYRQVQVGTMQTVVKRMHAMKFTPDLIIVDECHRSMGKTYQDILAHYPDPRVLGVTATPVRGDGKPLGEYFESMVVGPTVKELIAMGALVKPRTFGPKLDIDLSGVGMSRQEDGSYDFNRKQVEEVIDRPGITGDAIERYDTICPGLPAVAFCVSIKHAKHIAQQFKAAGYIFEPVYGDMPDRDIKDADGNVIERGRNDILDDLRNGRIHGITSVDIATEGLDIPSLQVAIMLRPTTSEGLYLQMAGRVLRPWPGKNVAYILDHAGCTKMHKFVTSDRHWTLDVPEKMKRKRKSDDKTVKTVQCTRCYMYYEAEEKACPSCGHVEKPSVADIPIAKKGLIVEYTEEQEAFLEFIGDNPSPSQIRKLIAEAKTFDELFKMETKYSFKKGWAKKYWAKKNKQEKIV